MLLGGENADAEGGQQAGYEEAVGQTSYVEVDCGQAREQQDQRQPEQQGRPRCVRESPGQPRTRGRPRISQRVRYGTGPILGPAVRPATDPPRDQPPTAAPTTRAATTLIPSMAPSRSTWAAAGDGPRSRRRAPVDGSVIHRAACIRPTRRHRNGTGTYRPQHHRGHHVAGHDRHQRSRTRPSSPPAVGGEPDGFA